MTEKARRGKKPAAKLGIIISENGTCSVKYLSQEDVKMAESALESNLGKRKKALREESQITAHVRCDLNIVQQIALQDQLQMEESKNLEPFYDFDDVLYQPPNQPRRVKRADETAPLDIHM